MALLHLANTYFEDELASHAPSPEVALESSKIFRHLQWLPFLYAKPDDIVLATREPPLSLFSQLPSFSRPRCHLFSDKRLPEVQRLETWGASQSVALWAARHHIPYPIPDGKVVREVNSKEYSYAMSPKLPGSALLYTANEVRDWADSQLSLAVLKTPFGLSGRGHLHLPGDSLRLESFIKTHLGSGRPLIGEPWVKRTLDFSTQWEILQTGEILYLGITLCDNDAKGRYKQTRVGNITPPFCFEEHKEIAMRILQDMKQRGYFGNVGFDAMVYENKDGKTHLHPIVEVNARKTMGWVALMMKERHFRDLSFAVSFSLARNEFSVILKPWSC